MANTAKPFGQMLRAKRLKKDLSLRKFAELVGLSPTYLSQVEQDKVVRPPTAERVKKMAEVLGENPDRWIASAGRMPDDLTAIIQRTPEAMPDLIRAASGLTDEQIRALAKRARRMTNGS